MGKKSHEGDTGEKKYLGRTIAAGTAKAGWEVTKKVYSGLKWGGVLVIWVGVVKPGEFVWNEYIKPKVEERRRRKEAEEAAERRREAEERRAREKEEMERRILARRDHQEELRRFKEGMRVRRILRGVSEPAARKIIEEEWRKIPGNEGKDPREHMTDPSVVDEMTSAGLRHRCQCCGQFASPSEGCSSCRDGWGPPRSSPDQMVRVLREKWDTSRYLPDLDTVLGSYQDGVHGVEEPVKVLVGMGKRPRDIPPEEWINMPDDERRARAKAIVVWRNGYVGVSRLPHHVLKGREGLTGQPMWSNPTDFVDSGYRVRPITPAYGRGWAGPQDIWVSRVKKKGRERGVSAPKKSTWGNWQARSRMFDSLVWIPEDLQPVRRDRGGLRDDEDGEGSDFMTMSEFEEFVAPSIEGEPEVESQPVYWGTMDREEAMVEILEEIGMETIERAREGMDYALCEEGVECPMCLETRNIETGCLDCTEEGLMPPVIDEGDIADYLAMLDFSGRSLSRAQGIDFAREVYGSLRAPVHYFYQDVGEDSCVWAVYDNGAVYEVLNFDGSPPEIEQLVAVRLTSGLNGEARLVLLDFTDYREPEAEPRFVARAIDPVSLEPVAIAEGTDGTGLTVRDLQKSLKIGNGDGGEVLHIQMGGSGSSTDLENRFAKAISGDRQIPHNRFITNSVDRIREIVAKAVVSINTRTYWLSKPSVTIDTEGYPVCGHCSTRISRWEGCECNTKARGPLRVTPSLVVISGKVASSWRNIASDKQTLALMEERTGDVIPPRYSFRVADGSGFVFVWGHGWVGFGEELNSWESLDVEGLDDIRIVPLGGKMEVARFISGKTGMATNHTIYAIAQSMGWELIER